MCGNLLATPRCTTAGGSTRSRSQNFSPGSSRLLDARISSISLLDQVERESPWPWYSSQSNHEAEVRFDPPFLAGRSPRSISLRAPPPRLRQQGGGVSAGLRLRNSWSESGRHIAARPVRLVAARDGRARCRSSGSSTPRSRTGRRPNLLVRRVELVRPWAKPTFHARLLVVLHQQALARVACLAHGAVCPLRFGKTRRVRGRIPWVDSRQ